MHDGTGTDQGANGQDLTMDAAEAAAIMAEASDRARRRLQPGHRVFYAVRGAIWILGYGIIWLAVRGQHPFHGTRGRSRGGPVFRRGRGAHGRPGPGRDRPARPRRCCAGGLPVGAGRGSARCSASALVRAGANPSAVGIFEASAPILVLGLLCLVRFSAERDWAVAGLGLWLVVVAAVGGYAGPAGVWAVGALAAGLAFLLLAAVEPRVRRA